MVRIMRMWLFILSTAVAMIGGLLPLTVGVPSAYGDAKPGTHLNEAQAVETARAFCRKIGQPVTAPGTATFATNSQGPPGHYWQPIWDVAFPGKAEVEVVDVTGIIVGYMNDAYSVEHQHDPHVLRQEGDPTDNLVSQQEAIHRANSVLNATGQTEALQFNWAQLESFNPKVTNSYSWGVYWYRVSQGVRYDDQRVVIGMDAQTGEIRDLVMMLPTPSLASVRKVLSQDDAISVAASQVISRFVQEEATHKETHLEIVTPDDRWPHSSDKQGQPNGVRLAWAVTFIVDGHWRQVYVDTETGEYLRGGADSGPAGRNAAATTAAPVPPPVAPMLQTVRAVFVRGKGAEGKWAAKPLLKFGTKDQPHAVATLRKTADFRKEGPVGAAPQEMVLVSKGGAIGVYSYFPDTGLLGAGSDWAAAPEEFKTWMQRKIAAAVPASAQGPHR